MDKIKTTTVKVTKHVWRHKGVYAMATLTTLVIVANARNAKAYNSFLTSKGIDLDEFYFPEMFAEKTL